MIIVKNRELLIPNNERYIGTTYDSETENRIFQVPRYSQRGVDLAALTFRLDIQYANESYDTIVLDKEIGEAFVILIWRITSSTLQVPGTMYIGLRAVDNEATVKWSSFSAAMYVERHLNTPGNYGGGLTEIEQMEQDHQYMLSVVNDLKANLDYAHDAEAWAQGTRNGSAVPSSDKTYQKNSKYYSEQANASKNAAANSATAAANSATQAAATVADTNTRFNNAVAAVTVDTEVQDARVGADGTQYTVLKNRLDAENSLLKSQLQAYITNGTFSIANKRINMSGAVENSTGDYMTDYIPCVPGSTAQIYGKSFIYNGNPAMYLIAYYDASKVFVSGISRISDETANLTGILTATVPEGVSYVVFSTHGYQSSYRCAVYGDVGRIIGDQIDALQSSVIAISDNVCTFPVMRNGAVSNPGNTDVIAMREIAPIKSTGAVRLIFNHAINSGEYIQFRYTTYDVDSGLSATTSNTHRMRADKQINADSYGCCVIKFEPGEKGFCVAAMVFDSNNQFIPIRITDITPTDFAYVPIYDVPDAANDGTLTVDGLVSVPAFMSNTLGTIKYLQAFCVYNGKIFSVNGSTIASQAFDGSAITSAATEDVSLSLGHGNSCQLGHGNLAYVSGWDDQTVYVVDLDTLTLVDTITLPTTGYTTAAIDDVNHIAYIFQRDTYPTTSANYTVIAYDYQNDTTVFTKKTTNSFAAMQACDFDNGKIIVSYGLGTESAPSGIVVYNTNIDMIAEYDIPALFDEELEGVSYDASSKSLLVSTVSQNVYRITTESN